MNMMMPNPYFRMLKQGHLRQTLKPAGTAFFQQSAQAWAPQSPVLNQPQPSALNQPQPPVPDRSRFPIQNRLQSMIQNRLQFPAPNLPRPAVPSAASVKGEMLNRRQPGQDDMSAQADQTKTQDIQKKTYSAEDLSEKDLTRIITLYGNGNIEEIYDVTGMQAMMIQRRNQVKDSYVLQMMLWTKLKLDPISFRAQIDRTCEKKDNLRSCYVYRGMDRPFRVVLKNRPADVSFTDLSDELDGASHEMINEKLERLMEADRRSGFDLERSSLLRVQIYKLDRNDTYAILISQPHVNSDGISVMMLFRDLIIAYGMKQNTGVELPVRDSSFREYAEYLKSVDKDEELAYWKEYLAGAGDAQKLPGYTPSSLDYELNLFFQPFDDETVRRLKELQKSTGATFATIIQAVWAVMLARLTDSEDIVLGSVTSGRDSAVANSMKISGGFINTLLLRCRAEPGRSFAELAGNLQTDYGQAMKFSHCSPDEIRRSLGRKTPFCNHVLNFHNYNRGKDNPAAGASIPGVQILGMDVYDNLSYDLVLYFRNNEDGRYGCSFSYNSRAYSRETIQLLGETFSQYLDAAAAHQGKLTVGEFPQPDYNMFTIAQEAMRLATVKKASFLKTNPFFASVSDKRLEAFAEACTMHTFMEDDRIYGVQDLLKSVYLVMDGYVDLSIPKKSGWDRVISAEGPGNMLSLGAVTGHPARMCATAASETVRLLQMPAEEFVKLMKEEPDLMMHIFRVLENRWLNYGQLWANAE